MTRLSVRAAALLGLFALTDCAMKRSPGVAPVSATPASDVRAAPTPAVTSNDAVTRRIRLHARSPSVPSPSPSPSPSPAGCAFRGPISNELAVSTDGSPAGTFARIYRGADVTLELGPPRGPARARATLDFITFDVHVAPDEVRLFAKRPLEHQRVFRTVHTKPVRVTASERESGVLEVIPKSWDVPVRLAFRKPTPFIAKCTDFGLDAGAYADPDTFNMPSAWMESKRGSIPTTLSATPQGPPVLDVLRSVEVRVFRRDATKVFWETEDGLFSGFVDPRALYEPPGAIGHGGTIGTMRAVEPQTGCKETTALYALQMETLEATEVGIIPPEGRLEVEGTVPWEEALGGEGRGGKFVYVTIPDRLALVRPFRLIAREGEAMRCRRSASP